MKKNTSTLPSEDDLAKIERDYPQGLTTSQIVQYFWNLEIKFSEATLRKYVQLGLLPGSRRVGRGRGLHRGSQGLYPPYTVRLILKIREYLDQGLTLAQIAPQMQGEVALARINEQMMRLLADPPSATDAQAQQHWEGMRQEWRELHNRLARLNRELNHISPAPTAGLQSGA